MRLTPHNIEAEQALLGALLVDNRTFEDVSEIVGEESFYEGLHGVIYRAIALAIQAGRAATPVTLKDLFAEMDPISDNLTVPQYLGRLASRAATTINARHYAVTVRDLAQRRTLIDIGESLAMAAYDGDIETKPSTIIEEAEGRLYALAEPLAARSELSFASAAKLAFDDVHAAYQAGGVFAGAKTGFVDLDQRIGGLGDSDLVVLAGRPAIGKTAMAVNIAVNVSRAERILADGEVTRQHVHVFSLEMSARQLATRILSDRSGVSSERMRRGDVKEPEIRRIMLELEASAKLPMTIDESGGLSVAQIAARARRVKRKHGTRLIIIDYLQLMRGTRRSENRVQEVTEITTGLKALAKELHTPILALSQLSRKVEERSDKRPQLADLRESGSIEQDADTVLFVFRDEYYLARDEPDFDDVAKYADWQDKMGRSGGKAEVIVAKNRHGSTGIVHLSFDAGTTRFGNLARGGNDARAA